MQLTEQPSMPTTDDTTPAPTGSTRRHVILGAAITALGGLLFGYDTAAVALTGPAGAPAGGLALVHHKPAS
jgi:hypothetical protein